MAQPVRRSLLQQSLLRAAILAVLHGFVLPSAYSQPLDPPLPAIGRVLANPAVVNLYWHDEWDNAVANQNFLQAKIDAEVRGIMDGYYLNGADQYGVMRGRFVSSHQSSALCRPSRAPAVVDSLAILSWVTCQVSLPGTDVPIPLRDTIYMVFLPPGTVVRNPSRFAFDSCPPSPRPPGTIGFRGYHSGSIGWPYAVIPLSCHTGMETLTNTISHEIVEAATDPFGTGWLVGPPLSLSLPGVSVTKSQEAAHKCEDAPQGRLGPYWSNRSNQCITGLAPLARGNPLAYVTDDSVPRVVYRGADDHIEELRLEGSWNAADLSAMVGDGSPSVPAAGDPQAYTTPDLISRVVYRGQDSHIHELRLQGGWLQADLTAICAGNAVAVPAAGNPHAYVTPDSIPRVVYRGKDGHIHELRLQGSGWIHADLSAIVVNRAPVVPAVGTLTPTPPLTQSPGWSTGARMTTSTSCGCKADGCRRTYRRSSATAPPLLLSREILSPTSPLTPSPG